MFESIARSADGVPTPPATLGIVITVAVAKRR
jgi:hypothetical protein